MAESRMFQDEAVERMVLDAFDELCADAGVTGVFADEGPMSLALVPDPLRLGAAVDLWMRLENRDQNARQSFAERTSILGSHMIDVPDEEDLEDEEADQAEDPAEEEDEDDDGYVESTEPLLDELELRGRLLVDVLNAVSLQLSNRRGALELGEALPPLEEVRRALDEAIALTFDDERLADLWANGALVPEAQA